MTESGSMVGAWRRSEPDELEAGLNSLIERRASAKQGADEREESWKESVRAYNAEVGEANRHAWRTYYRRLSESFRLRSEECAQKAMALDPGEDGR